MLSCVNTCRIADLSSLYLSRLININRYMHVNVIREYFANSKYTQPPSHTWAITLAPKYIPLRMLSKSSQIFNYAHVYQCSTSLLLAFHTSLRVPF